MNFSAQNCEFFDTAGLLWYTENRKEAETVTRESLLTYLQACPTLENPLLVAGHPAPDTDAVVSALFEAWRLTLSGIPAVPVVQGTLSRETAWLLGDVTIPAVSTDGGNWVLTDHHDIDRYPGGVVAIVDHHPVAQGVDLTVVDVCIRPVGAATTLVAQRLKQAEMQLDATCARILLGAILLDTEGLSPFKAKPEDLEMVGWLTSLCDEEVGAFYDTLKEQLLSESDPAVLYRRDYRAYTAPDGTPLMGFAILKVKQGNLPDLADLRRRLAQDVAAGGYAVAVAKVVLYAPDNSREEYYLAAGPAADTVLTEVTAQSGPSARRTAADEVFLPADCRHWGRKRYAVKLMEILQKKE